MVTLYLVCKGWFETEDVVTLTAVAFIEILVEIVGISLLFGLPL